MILQESGLRVVRSNKKYAVCHCPYPDHSDRHASSVVYLDNMWFVCFRCHISKPLEKVLKELELGVLDFERMSDPKQFNPVLWDEEIMFQPPTQEALDYMEQRGIPKDTVLPEWVKSPLDNRGVGFLFQNSSQQFGGQIRLFPAFVTNQAVRYVLYGKRLPWFGDMDRSKRIVCFEKAFGALKASLAIKKAGLPLSAISCAGSNFQVQLLDLVKPSTIFFFDDDEAGRRAAKNVKTAGFRVLIPNNPIDDLTIDEIAQILEKKCT